MTYQFNAQYPPSSAPYAPQLSSKEMNKPTAPPLENIQTVPGYEYTQFAPTILLPPPVCSEPQQPLTRREIKCFAGITEEEVRDAAIQYASENCCYGMDTVKHMKINDIIMSSAFHYTLETFAEKRETAWSYQPYKGEPLDTPLNGIPPGPWEIPQTPSEQFKNSVLETEVPHTASAVSCHVCIGHGRVRCSKCNGYSQIHCSRCFGSGRKFNNKRCSHCNGNGMMRCTNCCGTGQIKCETCSGRGNLKCYVKLKTTWTNHKDDFIFKQTDLPNELIHGVTGHVAFHETFPRVWPISNFPQFNVNEASKNLVAKHNQAFPTERIVQQRHQVRIVPVAQAQYSWERNYGNFFVYGFENKVHFPDYPQSCCWICNIL